MGVTIEIVPCLKDNYAYVVSRSGDRRALVVDPSEGEPVRAALERLGLELAGILCTHHHHDHVGGNQALLRAFPGIAVFGSRTDATRIPGITDLLDDGDEREHAGFAFRALHVPGHTLGAIAYRLEDAVFTGDTLFVAGCGRLFEGTPAQMHASLNEKLAALPPSTKVYCGHEYTLKNLEFAAHVEPDNEAVRDKLERVRAARARGEPTVPSTIGEERATNPFLRCDAPTIRARMAERGAASEPVAVFAAVRRAKDTFA
ncbi:MAG: hydroxyacylglutathione hydrolase [Pseudomonadota bacterium]|nr:MAG: hydroxyacylglutathione hydrolase [Pseudomonadota bacterium]